MAHNSAVFNGMLIFCEVVEADGFAAAARNLGHSASHISKEIARLEARLGTRLLNRTTRRISLTEAGRIYFESARQIVSEAREAEQRMLSVSDRPFGQLRVSAPVIFCQAHLNGWLPEFLTANPGVQLRLEASEQMVDMVSEGFDVVLRIGRLADTDLIARKLMTTARLTVASPQYLAAHGTPKHPGDLAGHALIEFASRAISGKWTYIGHDGKPLTVSISPRVVCDSAETEIALASAGLGITRLPAMACHRELASGALVPVLAGFQEEPASLHALYPSRVHLAAKVRAFVDFLAEKTASTGIAT